VESGAYLSDRVDDPRLHTRRFSSTWQTVKLNQEGPMANETFTIPNISCGHCVAAVKDELSELAGVQSVEGDPTTKAVTVQFEAPATVAQIRSKLTEINYPAA
jgi:copper chaperone CopZ